MLWTAKHTNGWVLDKAGVSRNLLESVKARKISYFGHIMRKKSESLEKLIMQGTTPGSHTRGRPKTTWMDNILQWTGYTLDKTVSCILKTESSGDSSLPRSWCGQASELGWLEARQDRGNRGKGRRRKNLQVEMCQGNKDQMMSFRLARENA